MQPDQAVIDRWRAVAPSWETHSEVIRQMFAPVTEALIQDGQIANGHEVLDIATGAGEPALTVAARVGTEGRVIGVDPVPDMVAAARRAADHLASRNTRFEVAFADDLPFPSNTFDAVISRFGVMFFPSPLDGVREMLRVLRLGRKLALAVWHVAERNPFFYTISQAIAEHLDSPPPEPDAAEAFRFASPGKLRNILAEAGVTMPSERLLQFSIQASVSAEDFWTLRCEISESIRQKLAMLSEGQLADVKRKSLDAFRGYATGQVLSFPAEVLIVSGTKSFPS